MVDVSLWQRNSNNANKLWPFFLAFKQSVCPFSGLCSALFVLFAVLLFLWLFSGLCLALFALFAVLLNFVAAVLLFLLRNTANNVWHTANKNTAKKCREQSLVFFLAFKQSVWSFSGLCLALFGFYWNFHLATLFQFVCQIWGEHEEVFSITFPISFTSATRFILWQDLRAFQVFQKQQSW